MEGFDSGCVPGSETAFSLSGPGDAALGPGSGGASGSDSTFALVSGLGGAALEP